MSSKSKSTKKSTVHYYGCVYGGVMKQGYVYFFKTTDDPDEYFSQFQSYYGNKVRGRFVKASDEEDYLEKVQEKLSDHQVHGTLYEVSVDTASKTLKELTGAKKTSLLGEDEHAAEDKGAKSEAEDEAPKEDKKVKVKASKKEETVVEEAKPAKAKAVSSKKAKAVESEAEESEDEQPSEAESEAESEPEVKETKKPAKAAKESSKKEAPKKETKAKSSK